MARKRQDATGAFLRTALGPKFFPTSSGYKHCVTAGGVDLGQGGRPEQVLETFQALPESERRAGAVVVGEHGKTDLAIVPAQPPSGGLIIRVQGRMLARGGASALRHVTAHDFPLMADYDEKRRIRNGWLFEPSTDHLWILEREWRAWISKDPQVGETIEVSDEVVRRLARFHLSPQRIYAEGGEWHPKEIRAAKLDLTVAEVTATSLRFELKGRLAMGSEYDAEEATTPNGPLRRGYEANVWGEMNFDRGKGRITGLKAVVLGDAWGRVGDANGKSVSIERPGRNPLGFALELVTERRPVDCLVPMGRASKLKGFRYFGE